MREKGIQFFKFQTASGLSSRILSAILLVLITASMANATLQISVEGNPDPIDSEIVVMPSDTLSLDIWTDSDIVPGTGEWSGWALVCQSTDASISGGVALIEDAGIVIYDDAAGNGFPVAPGENGVWGTLCLLEVSSIPAGTTIYDEIQFHAEWGFDVVVTLYGTDDWETSIIPLDSVVIHIPEPATVLLLGLGIVAIGQKRRWP